MGTGFGTTGTNQTDNTEKAWRFSQAAYNAELDRISREYREKVAAKRNELAARGTIMSGYAVAEMAGLNGERITLLLQKRLQFFLEGCELHGVPLDDQISARIVDDIMQLRETMIGHADRAFAADPVFRNFQSVGYRGLLEQRIDMSPNWVRVQIERCRLATKPGTIATNVYHVYGHNPRWVTNGTDQSLNIVTVSSEQVFNNLRQVIEASVTGDAERNDILEKLAVLKDAQSTCSFAKRYTDFIAAAANHMVLIGPFIPALTELLHRAL